MSSLSYIWAELTTIGKELKICEVFNPTAPLYHGAHQNTPAEEIFNHTLAFFCTLLVKGCSFDQETNVEDLGLVHSVHEADSESDKPQDGENLTLILCDCQKLKKENMCKEMYEIRYNKYEQPFLQYIPIFRALDCLNWLLNFHRCQKCCCTDTSHLIIWNLDEFDIGYLPCFDFQQSASDPTLQECC